MAKMPIRKYKSFPPIDLPDRHWPAKVITEAPIWCSVDLRDGNQALMEPMGFERKIRMFNLLTQIGYKEIEIGFPSASQSDFVFTRELIEGDLIPDDVTVQVIVSCCEHLISRTFEALVGVKRAIVHFYNSTSALQRRVVFNQDRQGIKQLAVDGAKLVKKLGNQVEANGSEIIYQYSPENFNQTEMDYALEVCEAVKDVIQPTPDKKFIINLPATVEVATPNVYADQIEWFCRNVKNRDSVTISVHPHNDRGTAVATAEFALMAGADRVEGTLFGNGERSGNVDLVTVGMNMVSQGLDAGIDFSNIPEMVKTVQYCNRLPVHHRHPYGGDLVFTAFSGGHQDAIKKGLAALEKSKSGVWEVPYLPVDPRDVGSSYETVIRVNSQSGKSGVAYLLEADHGIKLPRKLQIEFSGVIQQVSDNKGKEITSQEIWEHFDREYLSNETPYAFVNHRTLPDTYASMMRAITATVRKNGKEMEIRGRGNGMIDAYVNALKEAAGVEIKVVDYSEHTVGTGASSSAIACVEARTADDRTVCGVGRHPSIVSALLKAITCAVNRATG